MSFELRISGAGFWLFGFGYWLFVFEVRIFSFGYWVLFLGGALGFRLWDFGFGLLVWDLGFDNESLKLRVQDFGF